MKNAHHAAATFLFILLAGSVLPAQDTPEQAPNYNNQIAPIFRKYCSGCHNADDAEGKLVLDSYDRLLAGGSRGAALVPGKADNSRLVLMLTGKAKPSMPPEGSEAPGEAEIALLRRWIDAGAPGPTGKAVDPTRLVTPQVKSLAPQRAPLSAVAFSPDGKLLALAGYAQVRLVAAGSRATVREIGGLRGNVNAVAFSPDGKTLLAAGGEPGLFGEARLVNVADGKLVRGFVGGRDSLYAAVLAPDGKTLATAGYDEQINLWNAADGTLVRTLEGHNGAVFDLAFSPDGKLLASASGDRTVKLWDVASGKRIDTFGQSLKEVYTVVFSPDGRRVAAAGVDNRIRVWKLSDTAAEGTNDLVYSRFAHERPIIKLAWSADGASLASAAEDRTLKLWDAAALVERHLLERQPDWTPGLAFDRDGKRLAVARLDGSYALYDVAGGKPIPPPAPQLAGLPQPRAVQRGVATRLKLTGKFLIDVTGLKFSHAGLRGKPLPQGQDKAGELWVEVTPAADLPRGTYEIVATGAGGSSGPVKLEVDDLPQIAEREPNDTPAEAQVQTLPAAFWGAIAAKGDTDCYAFQARAGETLVLDLAAQALGSKLNGVLTLYDDAGRVVAASNDFDGDADPLLAFTPPRDGRYTVRVSDLALGASAEHVYRLSAGKLPLVTGCYPLAVPPGGGAEIALAGYNLPENAAVKVAAGASGEVSVPLDPERYRSRRPLQVLVGLTGEALEQEPNDDPQHATPLELPAAVNGRIWPQSSGEDVDLFRFTARGGEAWILETQAARRGAPTDTKIEVLDAQGQPVPRLLLQATRDSYITFRPIDSQTVDARVANWEEMELNEWLYMQGEVVKLFRLPQGPDSGFNFYGINGARRCYFDTSPSTHSLHEPVYIVRPHPVGTRLVPNGLPVFPLYYANDDDGLRKLGSDSRLTFTAPADGEYLVRVSDVRGQGGDRFAYRLVVRRPQPDFRVTIGGGNATVNAGSGKELTFRAERIDGFEGDIELEVTGLPPGFSVSTPLRIQAGHLAATAALHAAADAPQPTAENGSQAQVIARAVIDGQQVSKEVGSLGRIRLAAAPKLIVTLEPKELTIHPGTTVTARLRIERNGFDDLIRFNVNNLPHGVIVDNIGLNGVLIPKGKTERTLYITARDWVPETTRPYHAVAPVAGTQVSAPVLLHVKGQ